MSSEHENRVEDDCAIKLEEVSKCFHIYDQPHHRFLQGLYRGKKQFFKEFWALRDISFSIRKGETVGIIGRNGSGKSTLLQIICGTLMPTGGRIETQGRIAALLELGSGFNPEFTGRENVYLNGTVLGLTRNEIDARFDDIASFADIGQFLDQPLKTYSSGMLVRLGFAVIAHVNADILIVDEALSVGDAVFVQRCNRFIRKFREEGTLLFVSHSNQVVLDLCDRAIWLNDGGCVKDEEAVDVIAAYSAFTHQQINKEHKIKVSEKKSKHLTSEPKDKVDHRRNVLENSNVRYDLQLYSFTDKSTSWGAGGARITGIKLYDTTDSEISCITSCMDIILKVYCHSETKLMHPVIGFTIRNIRGLEIISENTHLSYIDKLPPTINSNQKFHAEFQFFLPYLASGDYFIGAAIADGKPGSHIQMHRSDDALKFSVATSHVVHAQIAMPLNKCGIVV